MPLSEDQIRTLTQQYWDAKGEFDYTSDDYPSRYIQYIQRLLPLELETTAFPENRRKIPHLILMVGDSWEPLLQSICYYRPTSLYLLLNQQYGKREYREVKRDLESVLEVFGHDFEITFTCEFRKLNLADQASVFECLNALSRSHHLDAANTIIDITGSKKSMVADAYLFASLSNIPVSYVDYPNELYEEEYRRPYGYRPQIGILANPMSRFALREWEQLRLLYARAQFGDAMRLLRGNPGQDQTGTLAQATGEAFPEAKPTLQNLENILEGYAAWENGDYNTAGLFLDHVKGVPVPTAVTVWQGKWYILGDNGFEQYPSDFYADQPNFHIYLYDELARIGRLLCFSQDYRSAFLRAASLCEFVNLARLLKAASAASAPADIAAWHTALQFRTPEAGKTFDLFINGRHGTLTGKELSFTSYWNENGIKIPVPNLEVNLAAVSWYAKHPRWGADPARFLNLRNDITHKFYNPSKIWAEDALSFAEANVRDFCSLPEMISQPVPWCDLCAITGLDQLLPPHLIPNPQEVVHD